MYWSNGAAADADHPPGLQRHAARGAGLAANSEQAFAGRRRRLGVVDLEAARRKVE